MAVSAVLEGARQVAAGCTDGLVELHRRGDGVFVMNLCGGPANPENRWTLPFTRALHVAFDAVEAELAADPRGAPAALLTISSSAKFFSNGIDPAWLMNPATPKADLKAWNDLVMPAFARPILLPIPTICAIGGHGFGAGFMFALGFDYRIQKLEKGFLCANEIEIGVNTPRPELTLFKHAMPANAFFETVLHAKRWGAEEAVRSGVVHLAVPGDNLLAKAVEVAAGQSKLGRNRGAMSYTKLEVKGGVALEILKQTFPEGKQSGEAELPPGLRAHIEAVVVKKTLDKMWSASGTDDHVLPAASMFSKL